MASKHRSKGNISKAQEKVNRALPWCHGVLVSSCEI